MLARLVAALLVAVAAAAGTAAVPAASAASPRRPVRVVVGGPTETARVIFRSPPADPFVLTNFRNGFLSLTELDRHVLTFGVAHTNDSAPPPVSRPAAGLAAARQAQEEDDRVETEQAGKEDDGKTETFAFRQLHKKVPLRRRAPEGDGVLAMLEVDAEPAKKNGTAAGKKGKKKDDGKGLKERTFLHVGNLTVEGTVHVRKAAPAVARVPQWALVDQDDFESEASRNRWFPQDYGTCGYPDVHLGGACNFAKAVPTRTYSHLPKHSYLRIEARYHFLDKWEGEYGYAKADSKVVWTQVHHHCPKIWSTLCNGVSVCGDSDVADTLSTPVVITIPHTADELELSFGSSLTTDACDASFGIDDVKVFAL